MQSSNKFFIRCVTYSNYRLFSTSASTKLDTPPIIVDILPRPQKNSLKPKDMVDFLNKHIIGQNEAKRSVSNALRSRWRRQQIPDEELRNEIIPRNILMVGPTGVGKTEIARRLSVLVECPFIKVEATKFTEVGFHGRDVDQIIRDLVEIAIKKQRAKLEAELAATAKEDAEEIILKSLIGSVASEKDKNIWLEHLRSGALDSRVVTVNIPVSQSKSSDRSTGRRFDDNTSVFGEDGPGVLFRFPPGFGGASNRTERKKLPIKEALPKLIQGSLDKIISKDLVIEKAIQSVEQEGMVFIDEIDKICAKKNSFSSADASDEGVQRDLLPIIEGCDVHTKYGNVNTEHILFVCSGAFHSVKPSDLLAELQGRLPVRVSLEALTEGDFYRILTEPRNNLIRQQIELFATEGVHLEIGDSAIREVAKVAFEINSFVENIGARRLHTVIEKIIEQHSFEAPEIFDDDTILDKSIIITKESVRGCLKELLKKTDLHKFIL